MSIPKKALRESQLDFLTAGSAMKDGSHQIYQVSFIENRSQKKGFFKKLDPKSHYPELLAKINVATSLFKCLFQGKKSAEERLVFDDEDMLVGTLSIELDGFKPLNFSSEPVPTDASLKEIVIPCTKTLIKKNVMEVLFGRWFLDDDDAHPHNLSVGMDDAEACDLDFDMFFYWFTIGMKEPRAIIGTPKKRIALSVRDWETFPNVKDSKPYHWPTYQHPGQETLPVVIPVQGQLLTRVLPKIYADPTQFERLAREPIAQEQKFLVALKALLTFQPELARRRLSEHFGDMTLNYTSLDAYNKELRAAYEREFPTLCNAQTNVHSFVDFMMELYQKHYDNLYRVVVFYMGCKDNGYGLLLKPTYEMLYSKPSFYRSVERWMIAQNEKALSREDRCLRYDLFELQKRYHQIWRDAYAPTLKDLLHSCYQLTNQILHELSSSKEVLEVEGKAITDESLTNSWQLIGFMELSKDKIEPLIRVDMGSKLRDGLLLLVEFTKQFHAIAKVYYEKERKDLTEDDNLAFSTELKKLYEAYDLKLRQSLLHTTTFAKEYNRIASLLEPFIKQVNFQLHLTTTDEQMSDMFSPSLTREALSITHEEVIRRFNDSLFAWARETKNEKTDKANRDDKKEVDEFAQYIKEIIDTHYAPTLELLSARKRARPVKDFLDASKEMSGDNRLAYILSSGHGDTGELNMLLIKHLTPLMLQTHPIPSIQLALKDGSFEKEIATFTKVAVNYAKNDRDFIHLYSAEGIKIFYQLMYRWVTSQTTSNFKGIVQSALRAYEEKLSYFSTSRRSEVEGYFLTSNSHARILAMIFLNGKDSSSLNEHLFQKIVSAMQTDFTKNKEKLKITGADLIMQFKMQEHRTIYFDALKANSEMPSQIQDVTLTRL